MLGYHISITRHSRLVVPDEEIITGKVEQPGKEQIQESFNSQEKIMVASAAGEQRWFS